MFDDYVEHASDPPPTTQAAYSLPSLQYEGFEASPYEDDRRIVENALTATEAGFFSGSSSNVPQAPSIFELGRVQYTLPAPLTNLAVSSNILTMALKTNNLLQLNLAQADHIVNLALPTKKSPAELTISNIFGDPTGKHLLITTEQGENFYCYEGWTKARVLGKFKMVIESVAWNVLPPSTAYPKTSTREILLGARNGTIYEAVLDAHDDIFKSQDRYLQSVFTLPEKQPVTGIRFEPFSASAPGTPRRCAVVATTSTRIYQFIGPLDKKNDDSGKLFDALFEPYRNSAPKFVEIPGNLTHSELHFWSPLTSLAPPTTPTASRQMAWLTGSGIYHGPLALPPTADAIVDSPSLLPYPPGPTALTTGVDVPISICVTEFHFLLLYKDRVCAVSSLDERLIWEEALPLKPGERPLGLAADQNKQTYWLYTDSSLFELVIRDENRDVWRIYLKKSTFNQALAYAKDPSHRAIVNSALAEHQFTNEQYTRAAQSYAQSSTSFEEVALAFSDLGEKGRDGLRFYLVARLERCPKHDLTQRMLLATWLVEFYLSKINTLEDIIASESVSHDVESLRVERAILEDDLRSHFETYKSNLDKQTVYDLILSHGRNDVFLHYASVVGDFEKVLEHHVMEEEWVKAVDVLNRLSNLELHYRFSPVLMRNAPKEIVDAWIRQPLLDPRRLIPAILQHQHRSAAQSPLSTNHAIRYLQHIAPTSTSSTIHNLLLTLLISSSTNAPSNDLLQSPASPSKPLNIASQSAPEDLPLLRFLSNAPINPITSKPYYDLDYALRLCKQYGRLGACVHIYAQMAMWEECIDLALEMSQLDMAKANCQKAVEAGEADGNPVDETFRKKLWLKVAKYVVQDKKDIKTAMQLLDHTPVLKIEDILPFFPDFVVIDDFKEEICTALEGYSAHIDTLKAEMDEATRSAESIKNDIKELKNRFVTVEQSERCSTCSYPLLTRQFYVFPCQHMFHADCLIGQVKEYLPSHILRRLVALQSELVRKQVANGAVLTPPIPPAGPDDRPSPLSLPRQPRTQRTLLSSTFAPLNPAGMIINPAARLASTLNPVNMPRNLALAGDKLRDLVYPDALANAIGAGVEGMGMMWGGIGFGNGAAGGEQNNAEGNDIEKIKHELDELLAASCPLCEGVVAGLDKAFVQPGEVDRSWQL